VVVAVAFLEGRGVDRDEERGARYVLMACDGGYKPACELRKRLPPALVAKIEKEVAASTPPAAPQPPASALPLGGKPLQLAPTP
jgi:TPR repeat protein